MKEALLTPAVHLNLETILSTRPNNPLLGTLDPARPFTLKHGAQWLSFSSLPTLGAYCAGPACATIDRTQSIYCRVCWCIHLDIVVLQLYLVFCASGRCTTAGLYTIGCYSFSPVFPRKETPCQRFYNTWIWDFNVVIVFCNFVEVPFEGLLLAASLEFYRI